MNKNIDLVKFVLYYNYGWFPLYNGPALLITNNVFLKEKAERLPLRERGALSEQFQSIVLPPVAILG